MHTRTTLPPCKSEPCVGRPVRSRARMPAPSPVALTCVVSLSLGSVQLAMAGPTGGVVTGGQGTISNPNSNTTLINQSSNQLQINWNTFNVSSGQSVLFKQPTSTSVAFNNILDQNPSQIFGLVRGNGQVVLVNPNGFLIGRTGVLDVNSLVLSSLQAIDFNAASGRYQFSSLTNPGAVINEGTITAGRGGSVTLLGGQVSNSGTIVADYGTVNLAAGRTATLDLAGDGLLRLEVGSDLLTNTNGATSAVENSGSITATGGQVVLSAAAVKDVFTNLINNAGVVRANRIDNSGGTIELLGPEGDVVSSGTLDASAGDAQSTGGSVTMVGNRVGLFGNAVVNVSGASGGGTAYIGGGDHGENPDIPNAEETVVSSGATIDADAGTSGNGGHVVVWSDDFTDFSGSLSARGGSVSGDGGYAEVSGKADLQFSGSANLTAAQGAWGTLLLDPAILDIVHSSDATVPTDATSGTWPYASAESGTISDGAVVSLLTTGNVDLQGTNSATLEASAVIDVSGQSGASGHSFEIDSHGPVSLLGTIRLNDGNVVISTDGSAATGTLTTGGASVISSGGGKITLSASGNVDLSGSLESTGGNITVSATGAESTLTLESAASIQSTNGGFGSDVLSLNAGSSIVLGGGSMLGTNINLTSSGGNIAQSASANNPFLTAQTLDLDAPLGSIGTLGSPLPTPISVSSVATLEATGGASCVCVVVQSGDTVLNGVSAAGGGYVWIATNGGNIDAKSVAVGNLGTITLTSAEALNAESVAAGSGSTISLQSADNMTVGIISTGTDSSSSVTLNAGGFFPNASILAASSGSPLISTYSLGLTATGGIGAPGSPVPTAVTVLSASAPNGDIYVLQPATATPATLDLGAVTGADSVSITNDNGGIQVQGALTTSNLSAGVVTLVSSGGITETSSAPLEVATLNLQSTSDIGSAATGFATSVNSLNATSSSGNVYIAQSGVTGVLTVNQASANAGGAGGTVKIVNTDGGIQVGTGGITTGNGGTVTLNVSGGTSGTDTIGDASGAGIVQTGTVNLTSASDIGTGIFSPLVINANSLNATSSGGNIYVSQQSSGVNANLTLTQVSTNGGTVDIANHIGSLLVTSVSTGPGGTVTLDASAGPYTITDTATASAITTGALILRAGSDIGSSAAGGSLLTNVNTVTAASSGGSVYLSQPSGNIELTTISAGAGQTVSVNGGGMITVDSISAPAGGAQGGTVDLTGASIVANNGASIIDLGTTDLGSISLTATGVTGGIGSSTLPIAITGGTLSATTNIGDIDVSSSGAVTLQTIQNRQSGSTTVTSTNGDITVGIINAFGAVGTVTLDAQGGSIDGTLDGLVTADKVNFTASGSIGSSATPVYTEVNTVSHASGSNVYLSAPVEGGQTRPLELVNVSAAQAVNILTDGQLTVDTVSGGNVTLQGSSIVDNGSTSTAIVAATTLNLTATSGTIGTAGAALQTDAGTVSGSAASSVYVNASNSVTLQGLTAGTNGSISVTAATGNISVDSVSAPGTTGQIALDATAGSILQVATPTGPLAANSLQLTAANGAVGAAGAPLETATLSLAAISGSGSGIYITNSGDMTASNISAGTDVQITTSAAGAMAGNLSVVSLSGPVEVELTASGSIENGGGAINATTLNMSAGGSIGAAGGAIQTDATNIAAQSTNGGVVLQALGNATLGNISAGDGDAVVTAAGNLLVDSVSATGTAQLTSQAGFIAATGGNPKISGLNIILGADGDIGSPGTPLPTAATNSLSVDSGNGSIYINQSGSFTLSNATASAVNSTIDIADTSGDMTVGSVEASATGGQVSLIANAGAILADTAAPSGVSAGGGILLQANTGVGTVTNFATLAGKPIDVSTNGTLAVTVSSNAGQINLDIGGSPVMLAGAITLGNGTGVSGTVVLQSPADLNISNLTPGAIRIGNGNTASVGLSSGGILTLPANEIVTDAPPLNLFVQGATDVVASGGSHEFSFTADELSFHSGAAGETTVLNTQVSQLDASVGTGSTLVVNQASGNLALGSIAAPDGSVEITAGGALTYDGVPTDLVTANNLSLTGAAVGALGAPISTQALDVSATAVSGDIYLFQSGAMTLSANATGRVYVGTSGSLTANSVAGGTGVVLTTDGTGADVLVNGTVNGGIGAVDLITTGAGSDINLNPGSLVTTSGPAFIQATSGAIVAGTGSELVSNQLNVSGSAIGSPGGMLNTQVGNLVATSSGGIYVSDAAFLNVTATSSGGPIDVAANGALTVASVSGTGVTLTTGGALALDGPVNGNGSAVMLSAQAEIVSNGGSVSGSSLDVTGAFIGLQGSPLNTTVAAVDATANTGDIYLVNTGALNLTASAPSGTVQVSTPNSSLTVASVTGNNVDLMVTGAGNTLTVDGPVMAGGEAQLQASGAIVAGSGSLVSAAQTLLTASAIGTTGSALNVGSGSVNASTTDGGIFLNGTSTAPLALTAAAISGTVNVQAPNGSLVVTSVTGEGVTLGAAGILVSGTIDGGADIVSLSATGAITADAGSTISAPTLQLTAGSIGSATTAMSTNATTVSATSSNGGIFVEDSGAVALTASATGGVLDVQSNGLLTVSSATGAGVTLTATNSSIDVNGALSGGSGPVALTAGGAGGTITLDGVLSTSGDVTLVAGTSAVPGAITTGTGGQIIGAALTATGSTLGTSANPLNTSVGTLTTSSLNGSTYIDELDGVALSSSVSGGTLNVQTNDGSITVNSASANGVTLVAGGAGSGISVNGAINGGSGAVTLTAGTTASPGSIVEGSGGIVTAASLTATAGSIGAASAALATNITTLNAGASQGDVYVTNQSGLALANVRASGNAGLTASSGNLSVGSVNVGDVATLTASAGTITDGTNSAPIQARSLTLLARSIGAPSTVTATGIDFSPRLNIDSLTLNATSTAGGIYIDALNSSGLSSVTVHASGGSAGNIELLAPTGSLYLQSVSASNTLLLSAGLNIYGLSGLGSITAQAAELRAGAADPSTGHIGSPTDPLSLQLNPGNTLHIFVPQTVDYHDPSRAPATLPSTGVVTTLSLYAAPSTFAVEAGFGQFQGLSDSLYTSPAESLVHSIQNQTTVLQNVVGLDWGSFDPNISLFGTLDPSVCLPSDQRDEESGPAGC
jgi:filamentous hemagglutinin family protein